MLSYLPLGKTLFLCILLKPPHHLLSLLTVKPLLESVSSQGLHLVSLAFRSGFCPHRTPEGSPRLLSTFRIVFNLGWTFHRWSPLLLKTQHWISFSSSSAPTDCFCSVSQARSSSPQPYESISGCVLGPSVFSSNAHSLGALCRLVPPVSGGLGGYNKMS